MYYDIKSLAPFLIKNDNLIRLGRIHDGGYILSDKLLENTELLISFGINADWSFEKDFKNKRDVTIHAYDFSVTYFSLVKKLIKYLTRFRFRAARRQFMAILDFKVFFNEKNKINFHCKGVGNQVNPEFLTFEEVMNMSGRKLDDSNRNVFVKIDIEGSEFDVIPTMEPYFNQIVGMAVEFHDLGNNSASFNALISLLKNDFHIMHVHGNNNDLTINGTDLPTVIEITFFNKRLVQENDVHLSTKKYPIKGLDYPNTRNKKEIPLYFS
jgi:hypothetical protein